MQKVPYKYTSALRPLEDLSCNKHLQYDIEELLHVRGLRLICQFGWWSRVWVRISVLSIIERARSLTCSWVVQETLLSTSAYLAIGDTILPWHTVYRAARNFVNHSITCCSAIRASAARKDRVAFVHEGLAEVAQIILSVQRVPVNTDNELIANL